MRQSNRHLEDATLVQESAGERDSSGVFVPGVVTRQPLRVATAPNDREDSLAESRSVLPQGARHRERRTFYLMADAAALRRGDAATDSDYIEYRDQLFRVQQVSDWSPHGFLEVVGVVPDVSDGSVPPTTQGFNEAPVIFPVEVLSGHTHILFLEIPYNEITTIDTGLTRAQVSDYHTLALSAVFPTFIQLISVPYLLHHDGLDTAIGYFHYGHAIVMHIELVDTLTIRFDLTQSETDITSFQIRGIG